MAHISVYLGITQRFENDVCKLVFCPWEKAIVQCKVMFTFRTAKDGIVFDVVFFKKDGAIELLKGEVKDAAISYLRSAPDFDFVIELAAAEDRVKAESAQFVNRVFQAEGERVFA